MNPTAAERDAHEAKMVALALGLGALAALLTLSHRVVLGLLSLGEGVGLVGGVLGLSAFAVVLWRRPTSLSLTARLLGVVAGVYLIGRLAVLAVAAGAPHEIWGGVGHVGAFGAIAYLLAYMGFSRPVARSLSLALWVALCALVMVVMRGPHREAFSLVDRFVMAEGVVFGHFLLIVFLEIFAGARTQARTVFFEARTDALTGLLNRRGAEERLSLALTRGGEGLGVILIDLDHFKRVNDRFGHSTGDDVLRAVAQIFRAGVGDRGEVGRWGGEEFLVMLPGVARDGAEGVAERLRARLAGTTFPEVGALTASFGVAAGTASDDSAEVVARADRALYKAKQAGRNRARVSTGPFRMS